ncbi:MAG: universal stress protein [Chitinophagaceae bacterium]|nr:universal stress protein [Chitinophagaceae bacterium]MBL0273391.1 universal stress protein [Chitinophagaceae bacterium]
MQTVIVPVDFSESSLNAARYAVQLLNGHYGVNLILHHVYDKPGKLEESGKKMEDLKTDLTEIAKVHIEILVEEGADFIAELEKLARHREADLIIMGITGRSVIGQTFIGSNTLKMVEKKICPVLIIPPEASYHNIKNVLLTSDFKDVLSSTPSVPIKKILKTFRPHFHIMNVDSEHYVALTEAYQSEKAKLQEMFKDFDPQFYFLGLHDVDEAISQFSKDKKVELIIVVHQEQTLFSKLFVKSHTKKLIYHSSVPVLAMHE